MSNKELITKEIKVVKKFPTLEKIPVLFCLSGLEEGAIIRLDSKDEYFIGRDKKCDILLDSPEISREHAKLEKNSVGMFVLTDLGSKNGVFVNGKKVDKAVLHENDKIRFGPYIIWKFLYQDEEEQAHLEKLYKNSSRDFLTDIFNRRYFMALLKKELSFSLRHRRPLTLAILDLDHFKKINDSYGHFVGDLVLKEFVRRIEDNIRNEDIFARYGGEEFSLLVREEHFFNVEKMFNRILKVISQTPFSVKGDLSIRVTASIGFVTYEPDKTSGFYSVDELIREADQQLYLAKESGRNRVCGKILY